MKTSQILINSKNEEIKKLIHAYVRSPENQNPMSKLQAMKAIGKLTREVYREVDKDVLLCEKFERYLISECSGSLSPVQSDLFSSFSHEWIENINNVLGYPRNCIDCHLFPECRQKENMFPLAWPKQGYVTRDSTVVCSDCIGEDETSEDTSWINPEEAMDSPCHCEDCGSLIDTCLSDHGAEYVIRSLITRKGCCVEVWESSFSDLDQYELTRDGEKIHVQFLSPSESPECPECYDDMTEGSQNDLLSSLSCSHCNLKIKAYLIRS